MRELDGMGRVGKVINEVGFKLPQRVLDILNGDEGTAKVGLKRKKNGQICVTDVNGEEVCHNDDGGMQMSQMEST